MGVLSAETGLEGWWGGARVAPPPPPPWLFSEREVRDLRRLKKPLFLDSRFFSAASWTPGGGAFAPGSLYEKQEEELRLRQDVTLLPATGPALFSHLKLSLMTFLL